MIVLLTVFLFVGCSNTNTYTVSFDSMGGTTIDSQTVKAGESVKKPSDPQKEGFTFVEWQLNDESYDFNLPVSQDITLTAFYKIKEGTEIVSITLDYQNGQENKTVEIIKGGQCVEPLKPQKSGYEFVGWYTNEEKFDFSKSISENIILIAKWKKAKKDSTATSNKTNTNNSISSNKNTNVDSSLNISQDNMSISDYIAFVKKYVGRWYLEGYSDIYIDIARLGNDESMHIEAMGISLSGDTSNKDSYVLYPTFIDGYNEWYHSMDIPFSSWVESINKKQISFGNTFIKLGNKTFIKEKGTKDKYTGTFCKESLGTWYLQNNSDVRIIIKKCGGNEWNGDFYSIETYELDLSTLKNNKNDFTTITAANKTEWSKLGMSVNNNTLKISNSYGALTFYREKTSSTDSAPSNPTPSQPHPILVSSVKLNKSSVSLTVGDTQQLIATVLPSNADNKNVTWTSSKSSVAQISSSGKITAKGKGSATITVTTNDGGYKATCTVTVKEKTTTSETPVYTDVLIISDTRTISNETINTDVYITSAGIVTFNNVTVNGNVYCYGRLTSSSSKANNVYAYAYGSMMSCGAFDGTHGKVSGGISCNNLTILDNALDYAFNKWGKK